MLAGRTDPPGKIFPNEFGRLVKSVGKTRPKDHCAEVTNTIFCIPKS